jgi:hypothetical protein
MKWEKQGLIYGPDGTHAWAKHTALTPTPILVNSKTIRIYAGFRDDTGVSRIGYVDVDADDPSRVKFVSPKPVLEIGMPGTFDDNGVILGDIVQYRRQLYMYYVGFQLVQKVKFLAFTGLAKSSDGGESFEKFSAVPVLDRSQDSIFIRAVHSAMIENGKWKFWFASGSGWEVINNKAFPRYVIKYCESPDGIAFDQQSVLCIDTKWPEYRIGRPRVYKIDGGYRMIFTAGDVHGKYLPGYAESDDGIHWERKDSLLGLELSNSGWDSKTLCYPALITSGQNTYLFYNGNEMGKDGFGYAVLRN